MGDNRPAVYYEGSNLIIRTSAIGSSCLWELVAAGQGYEQGPVPDFLQRAFDAGNELEPIIIGLLGKRGFSVYGEQEEGELVVEDNLTIRFHPDGYIQPDTQQAINISPYTWPRVLEVKALSDGLWQKAARGSVGDCIDEYNWQLSVMMHKENMPATWVAYNKGHSDGQPCTDKGRLLIQHVDTPPISLTVITERARLIKSLVEGEDIVASGRPCDSPDHFPCRYLHLRPEPEQPSVMGKNWVNPFDKNNKNKEKVMPPDDSDSPVTTTNETAVEIPPQIKSPIEIPHDEQEEVNRIIRDYVYFKGQADEAKKRQDEAKLRLIEIAQSHNKIVTDQWIVPVVKGGASSYDWASMPQELKDELAAYKRSTPYLYIRDIKRLGFDEE